MSPEVARIASVGLIVTAIVLVVLAVSLDGNRMWLALVAVACGFAAVWLGAQGRGSGRRT